MSIALTLSKLQRQDAYNAAVLSEAFRRVEKQGVLEVIVFEFNDGSKAEFCDVACWMYDSEGNAIM